MEIRVMVLDKEGNVVAPKKGNIGHIIKATSFNKEIHRHLSGREFTADEVKGFGVKAK